MATIDLFILLGKSEEYAKNMGETARDLAIELNPEIYDDRGTTIDFRTKEQRKTIKQIERRDKSDSILKEF